MADIFISYSSKDRSWVSGLVDVLKSQGYRVWWDRELLPGDDFQPVIQSALDAALCVVVVWSEHSVTSQYVRNEANRANAEPFKKLIPVHLLDNPQQLIPEPFGVLHAQDFSKWDYSVEASCFEQLRRSVQRFAGDGSGLVYEHVSRMVEQQRGLKLLPADVREHEQQYLRRVMHDCMGLEWLRWVRSEDTNAPVVGLDAIYTPLLTTKLDKEQQKDFEHGLVREEQSSQLSAVEVLNEHNKLVLTGTPGSGKSAFVNYLVLCFAGENLVDHDIGLENLTESLPDSSGQPKTKRVEVEGQDDIQVEVRQSWDHQALIPVRVILRDFSASGFFPTTDEDAETRCLLDFLYEYLDKKGLQDYTPLLEARMRSGEALILFDGLDEVPQAGNRRSRLIRCIECFTHSFDQCRFLVTCRPYAYEKPEWQLPDFCQSHLADFNQGQAIRFIDAWYLNSPDYPDADVAGERAKRLQNQVLKRDSLRKLAGRPLLLSLIAYLDVNHYELPRRRADLYEKLLDLLIDKWERARFKANEARDALKFDQHSLAEYLQVGQANIRLALKRLAFRAHLNQGVGGSETADISARDLVNELLSVAGKASDDIKPFRLCEYLRDRVGILYQRGNADNEMDAVYTFPHRSFQEYLTASYFQLEEDELFAIDEQAESWQEIATHLGTSDPDRWREVVVLAGGIGVQETPRPAWDLVANLCPETSIEDEQKRDWGLRLAGEILAESLDLENIGRKHKPILQRVKDALPAALRSQYLKAVERVAAGRYMAEIGDSRQEVTDVDYMQFCYIPAGRFWMGQGEKDKDIVILPETPATSNYHLGHNYWLARFPVTVEQFRQYVNVSGGKAGDEDSLKGSLNSPVVWVSWNEAFDFCNWLTERWQREGWLPDNWQVSLPDEAQWEKAARGGLRRPVEKNIKAVQAISFDGNAGLMVDNEMPQRKYPYGHEISNECANHSNNIGTVSTVGAYPQGSSVYGCEELSGNVWEWTLSRRGDYPYPEWRSDEWMLRTDIEGDDSKKASRVLRGGAFNFNQRLVRCAVRNDPPPNYRDNYFGFRVCLSPLPLTDEPLNDGTLKR